MVKIVESLFGGSAAAAAASSGAMGGGTLASSSEPGTPVRKGRGRSKEIDELEERALGEMMRWDSNRDGSISLMECARYTSQAARYVDYGMLHVTGCALRGPWHVTRHRLRVTRDMAHGVTRLCCCVHHHLPHPRSCPCHCLAHQVHCADCTRTCTALHMHPPPSARLQVPAVA